MLSTLLGAPFIGVVNLLCNLSFLGVRVRTGLRLGEILLEFLDVCALVALLFFSCFLGLVELGSACFVIYSGALGVWTEVSRDMLGLETL